MKGQARLPDSAHTAHPWRIHEITPDFRLEDVWALPTPGRADEFPTLVEGFTSADPAQTPSRAARALWSLRWKLGDLFGLDDPGSGLGSRVTTLRERLPADLRAAAGPEFETLPFTPLYLTDDEFAAEIANQTMHGVLHLGWVADGRGGYRGQMAVYVRPNGLVGNAYMAAIKPFRHLVVYPQMLRTMGRRWHEWQDRESPPEGARAAAPAWGAGRRRPGYAIGRRIAALDPVEDNEEATRLTFEVLYGDPIAVHAGYLVGFSRQVAVPDIARVVYRGGGGENLRDVARRTEDSLTLLGTFLHWGHSSPRGRAAIARMEQIHKRFAITDEQKLYTLATLIFEAQRTGRQLGFDPFTANQREASWRFWRGVAEQMPLGGLPPTAEELWRWMLEYEREHWRYTDDGRRVVDRFFEDWTTRWFPRPARGLGRQTLLALMDEDLRAVLRLEDPGHGVEWLLHATARAYLPFTQVRPLPTDRSWMDHFARRL